MGFREHLQNVVRSVDGAVACSLMGVDGIEVDTYLLDEDVGVDVASLIVELSSLLRAAGEASATHRAGEASELSILSERLLTVARLVSPEYFLVVALRPGGNFGKARYMLRVTAPRIRSEL